MYSNELPEENCNLRVRSGLEKRREVKTCFEMTSNFQVSVVFGLGRFTSRTNKGGFVL